MKASSNVDEVVNSSELPTSNQKGGQPSPAGGSPEHSPLKRGSKSSCTAAAQTSSAGKDLRIARYREPHVAISLNDRFICAGHVVSTLALRIVIPATRNCRSASAVFKKNRRCAAKKKNLSFRFRIPFFENFCGHPPTPPLEVGGAQRSHVKLS